MPSKTHHTAVAALPPEAVWEPIQAIRRQHDRQVHRWMPHINLLYPFLPRQQWDTVLPQLRLAAQQVAAFQVTLTGCRFFTHAAGRSTIWLAPEPAEAFIHLQTVLQAAVPDCDDLSRLSGGFTPHLSVGQAGSVGARQRLLETLQATWQPLPFTLSAIALIQRSADSPFQVEAWLPLAC